MASKVANTAEVSDAQEEPIDGPLLDTLGVAVKKLVARGKERGYITYDELNAALPPDEVSSEQIEDTMSMLSEMGINLVESEEGEETTAAATIGEEEVAGEGEFRVIQIGGIVAPIFLDGLVVGVRPADGVPVEDDVHAIGEGGVDLAGKGVEHLGVGRGFPDAGMEGDAHDVCVPIAGDALVVGQRAALAREDGIADGDAAERDRPAPGEQLIALNLKRAGGEGGAAQKGGQDHREDCL